jgi:hypothetical protein
MWRAGFLSVVAWNCSCETATFIAYSAKQQRSETQPATSKGHYTISCKNLSLALLKMGKFCPKLVELILEINKTVIVASSWCSILLYLQWWCTVTQIKEYPCAVCLVFMPCGALSTVTKIRYSYSSPSEIPVNGLLHELNSSAVRSQLCIQDWSHRQGIMSTEIGHLAHKAMAS